MPAGPVFLPLSLHAIFTCYRYMLSLHVMPHLHVPPKSPIFEWHLFSIMCKRINSPIGGLHLTHFYMIQK